MSLEAGAPLRAAEELVAAYVAGPKERLRARLVAVQVQAPGLRLVQLEVKVGVQPGEDPAQGVLADGHSPHAKF